MVRPSGGGNEALEFLAHLRSVHRMVGERWSPIFGQVVKVESRSERRHLECHERDGATRLS